MTAAVLAKRRTSRSAADGGAPARRAIVRWSWRLLRREWRQQLLVIGLLAVTVAIATVFATTTYNVAVRATAADFGRANHAFLLEDMSPAAVESTVAAARQWFGDADVVAHRAVPIPGSTETVDYRSQDPDGPYAGAMLDVRRGRYPATPGEVAVTDGIADDFGLAVGDSFDLDGSGRVVVGVVENPNGLGDAFALIRPDPAARADLVRLLVDADRERVREFRGPDYPNRIVEERGTGRDAAAAAISILAVTTVAMVLVALVATAAFVVLAQRRLRQLGMLGAIGASERRLRLVMTSSGTAVGVVGALVGAAAGFVAWVVLCPWLERAAGFRVSILDIPWPLVGAIVIIAVGASTMAATWPARAVARVSVVRALSGRPPLPVPVHRSTAVAVGLLGVGLTALTTAGELADETQVFWSNVLQVGAGTLITLLGVLMLCPLAVRVLGRCAGPLPVTARLALRDLARYQARSAAALAAISIALGIAVSIVAIAAAADHSAGAGNLSDRHLIVRDPDAIGPFVPAAAEVATQQLVVDDIVAALGDATGARLDAARDPGAELGPGADGRLAITVAERIDEGWRDLSLLYVATPEVIAVADSSVDPGAIGNDIVTAERGTLRLLGTAGDERDEPGPSSAEPTPLNTDVGTGYTSLPRSFVGRDGLVARGWEAVPSGRWLLATAEPITNERLGAVRELAARAGLEIEGRDDQQGLRALRFGATVTGMALALGVLLLTVGLIRAEAATDVRILAATGASSTARRNLTAATAAGLALAGVVLGAGGAYLVLVAGYHSTADLTPVPVVELVAIVLGTPVLAGAAGWLAAGREPAVLARHAIE